VKLERQKKKEETRWNAGVDDSLPIVRVRVRR